MHILIATDAWDPQVNGVVHSIKCTADELRRLGIRVSFLTPSGFPSVQVPTYPEIHLALPSPHSIKSRIAALAPDYIHIATEGPIGLTTRHHCVRTRTPFTTSYHTQFPEYVAARFPIPLWLSYSFLRWFHNGSTGTMVATASLASDLRARGFTNIVPWSRGVDHSLFRPRAASESVLHLPRPVFLYVGRVAVEKNLPAFLALSHLDGTKVVVGDGPARAELECRFPDTVFLGTQTGECLARIYASADVFVFPSCTDTFGIVILEALASGLPVAAFPVPGPKDVLGGGRAGVLDWDLGSACADALKVDRMVAREWALRFTWEESARQFVENVRDVSTGQPDGGGKVERGCWVTEGNRNGANIEREAVHVAEDEGWSRPNG